VIGGLGFVLAIVVSAPNAIGGLGSRVISDWVGLTQAGWDQLVGGIILFAILIGHQHGIADLLTNEMPVKQRRLFERLHLVKRPVEPAALEAVTAEPVAPLTLQVEALSVRFGAVLPVSDR